MPFRPDLSAVIFGDTRSPLPASTFENDPRLARFMPWFLAHSRATHRSYLLTHPRTSLVEPLEKYPQILSASGLETYRAPGFRTPPEFVEAIIYPGSGSQIATWAVLLCAIALLGMVARLARSSWIIPVTLMIASLPLAILLWDGEPSEIPRHGLLVGISARFGLIVGAWFVGEAAVTGMAERTTETREAAPPTAPPRSRRPSTSRASYRARRARSPRGTWRPSGT